MLFTFLVTEQFPVWNGQGETCKRNKLLKVPNMRGWHLLTFSYPCLSWFAEPQTVGPGTGVTAQPLSSSGMCSPPPPAPSSCLLLSSSLLGVSAWGGQTFHGAVERRSRGMVMGMGSGLRSLDLLSGRPRAVWPPILSLSDWAAVKGDTAGAWRTKQYQKPLKPPTPQC